MKKLFYKSLFVSLLIGLAAYGYWSLPDVSSLKHRNPKKTALMEQRDNQYRDMGSSLPRRQIWIPYEAASDHLKKAILISEDAAFFGHKGVDPIELKEAIRVDWTQREFKRGASTITMQLARNLYLSPSKNPVRKIKEIILAWQLEAVLSKKRIFELYLNVVEWGPNIYGAEAASRHYFGKAASEIDVLEAATLAALLPNPRKPREKELLYRRNLILTRMAKIGYLEEVEAIRSKETPLFKKDLNY